MMLNAVSYPPGREGFVLWLRDAMPQVYARIKRQAPELVKVSAGLGQATTPATAPAPASSSWLDSITKLAAPLINVYQQKKVMDMQLKRAQQGLAPLDVSQLQAPPTATVQVQTSPEITRAAKIGGGAMIALGVGGLALMFMRGRGRGRR